MTFLGGFVSFATATILPAICSGLLNHANTDLPYDVEWMFERMRRILGRLSPRKRWSIWTSYLKEEEVVTPDQNDVMAALENFLKEIEIVIKGFNQEGAVALNRGNYKAAKDMIDKAEEVTAFRERIKELKEEWEKSFVKKSSKISASEGATTAPIRGLKRGLRTPRKSYRLPILEALEELGGSAPIGDILESVYKKMRDRLTEYDHQPLPKSGMLRWRNTAMWCRYDLKEEGLLASNSPRGVWEITSAGRAELSRLRETKDEN